MLSSCGMLSYVKYSVRNEFIIGTEIGILHSLQKANVGKKFYLASELAVCPNMKLTNLEKILWALEEIEDKIVVPKEIADKARYAIQKMVTLVD
ncbi:MAG: quinolinate synthase NadA [Candidatus Pacearchaeota archaeon]